MGGGGGEEEEGKGTELTRVLTFQFATLASLDWADPTVLPGRDVNGRENEDGKHHCSKVCDLFPSFSREANTHIFRNCK